MQVFPSWVNFYGVHSAWNYVGGISKVQLDGECDKGMEILHMANMHKHRNSIDKDVVQHVSKRDPSWWWPYLPYLPLVTQNTNQNNALLAALSKPLHT